MGEAMTPDALAYHVIQSLTHSEDKAIMPHGQALGVSPDDCLGRTRVCITELQRIVQQGTNGTDHKAGRKYWQAYAPQGEGLALWYAGYAGEAEAEFEPEPYPPLPEAARLDPSIGQGAGAWLDQYIDYARQVSPMTPDLFHESAGLWLGAVAIARRLKVNVGFGDLYPNLYILWLAPTTLWRKTTALTVARDLARDVFPFLLSPQDTTPEGFISDLAGREPSNFESLSEPHRELWKKERDYSAQRGRVIDEMSGMLAAAGRDYNAGLLEAVMRFYDCDPSYTRSTRGGGRIIVNNAYLSILAASTPRAMARHLQNTRLWGMGWWPRFALLAPEDERPPWKVASDPGRPDGLVSGIDRLFNDLPAATWPDPPAAKSVTLGEGVHKNWQSYNKAMGYDLLVPPLDTDLWGSYGRLPTHVLKVSMILAALDGKEMPPTIELAHLARAQDIVEGWRASLHRMSAMSAETEYSQAAERILYQIGRKGPGGATMRDITRSMKDKTPREISEVLDQMQEVGEVVAVKTKPGKKGGRPTIRFTLAGKA